MTEEQLKANAFKPGQSGNPAGAKKGSKHMSALYRKAMKYKVDATDPRTGTSKRMTLAECMVLATIKEATKGNIAAVREITDRVEGKVAQPLTGADGQPLMPAGPVTIQVNPIPGTTEEPDE